MNGFSEDVGIGIYKPIDDVGHLKLRVHIKRTVPSSLMNEPEKASQSGGIELLQLQRNARSCSSESSFSWQEKVSKDEEKELRSSALALNKNGPEDSESCQVKLFTYLDSEVRSKPQFSSYFQGNSGDYLQTLKKRNLFSSTTSKTYQRPYILDVKDVVQIRSSKERLNFTGQSMAIMANIKQAGCDPAEVQLCLIHYDSSGTLIVIPDFSESNYYVRTADYGTYGYTIENTSKPTFSKEIQKERKFRQKVAEKHTNVVEAAVENEFNMPSAKSLIVFLNGEILSAKKFSASNIFVRYSFQFPEGMTALKEEHLTSTTHSCKVKSMKGVKEAHFGHPFRLYAELDMNVFRPEGGIEPVIHMVAEVCSVDSWGVCRSVGYGYCDIFLRPGEAHYEIKTWRFLPQTFIAALKEFFIGGLPSLEDQSYIRMPKDHQAKELNKYGTKTETSGTVAVKFHILLQFGCEASSKYFIN